VAQTATSRTGLSAGAIIAAMSDVRPGRFYSVDELAVLLHVQDRTGLHAQLRTMVSDPDVDNAFKLLQGSSDDFYQRVSVLPLPTLCGPWETTVS
jgi:hypothetical protein